MRLPSTRWGRTHDLLLAWHASLYTALLFLVLLLVDVIFAAFPVILQALARCPIYAPHAVHCALLTFLPFCAQAKHGLDSSVKQYHGYLATAVMILASLAGTAICGGICAVTYCYAKREKSLSDLDADGGRGEKKFYGRPTAQYGKCHFCLGSKTLFLAHCKGTLPLSCFHACQVTRILRT